MEERNGLNFATFFPSCIDIHLAKDVGMIPYVMYRDYSYNSYLICYNNGNYSCIESVVPGLELLFLNHNVPILDDLAGFMRGRQSLSGSIQLLSIVIDALILLKSWGRKIDVLQLYHLKPESVLVGLIYRIINRKGTLYLKLDLDEKPIAMYRDDPARRRKRPSLGRLLFQLASFDIITAETREVCAIVRDFVPSFKGYRDRIYYIPNGIDVQSLSSQLRDFSFKKDEILHVGRIGNRQKASELALEAFARVCKDFPSWELTLIGSIGSPFRELLEALKSRDISAADRVSYLGFVERAELFRRYGEAKIILVPSRTESFGLVAVEAGFFGDVILGSDIPPFRDLTDNGRFGYLCPVDDLECFERKLRYMLGHADELEEKSRRASQFIRKNFNWMEICREIDKLIQKSIGNKSIKK